MTAKYINQLIQYGYWNYDIIFIDENNDIVNRNNTFFYSEPNNQMFIDRVDELNKEYNYNITIIILPTI
jgi:hypothetical protein